MLLVDLLGRLRDAFVGFHAVDLLLLSDQLVLLLGRGELARPRLIHPEPGPDHGQVVEGKAAHRPHRGELVAGDGGQSAPQPRAERRM